MHPEHKALFGFGDYSGTYLAEKISDTEFKRINSFIAKAFLEEERTTTLDYMKELLEVMKMPVFNPKTNEYDTVDLSLVHKIALDSHQLIDMQTDERLKVSFSLSGDTKRQEVVLTAKTGELVNKYAFTLESFEELMFKTINEQKDQRIESVPEYQQVVDKVLTGMVSVALKEERHLSMMKVETFLSDGIGIIRDLDTGVDIGTFESLSYRYEGANAAGKVDHIILSGRTLDDLDQSQRFLYTYHSPEKQASYSFKAYGINQFINEDIHSTDMFGLAMQELSIIKFTEQHEPKIYASVVLAQDLKSFINSADKSHPLYDGKYQEFRKDRMSILEESKQRQKQDKLVSQFADIDLF